jgi:hypothetical protein
MGGSARMGGGARMSGMATANRSSFAGNRANFANTGGNRANFAARSSGSRFAGNGRNWHRGGRGYGFGAGFAAGALIGAGSYGYGYGYPYGDDYAYDNGYGYEDDAYAAAPAYEGGGDAQACAQQYRSYDPASGTYLGYDGARHPCP